MPLYTADLLYTPGQTLTGHALVVENGLIQAVKPLSALSETEQKALVTFPDAMIVPGFVNSHNHSFQSLLKGFCDDKDFFTWRDQALYKYATVLTEEDIYTGALFAFGEMLLQGITTVCDFFYINDQANTNARAVIRAAQDLGMRMVMARTLYDWEGAPFRFQETVDQAVTHTEDLMAEFAGNPMVSVLPAPHSLHGASLELIRAGAALAERHDTVFHMHIAEGQYERQMMIEKHGLPPIRFLAEQGLLSHRLVGIHCVWLDDEEVSLMGRAKAGLSYNPSSNMFLGDGVTRITDLIQAEVTISLGTDGGCSNNRASIVEEMRMTSLLQKVTHCDSTVITAEDVFAMGTAHGGKNLNLPLGKLATGYTADFVVLDLNDLSLQPRQNAPKNLVYALQPSALRAVYVAGRKVMEGGRILTVPEAEIVAKVQAITRDWG